MNFIMKAISALGNIQRDRAFREQEQKRRKVRKGKGFGEILRVEQDKLKGGTG